MGNQVVTLDRKTNIIRWSGFFVGIIAALLVWYFIPSNAGDIALAASKGKKLYVDGLPIVAAVAVLMGIWWMTEAISLPVTALLPMVLFPLLGVDTFKSAATPYASDIIYLFMGGFILALAMQKWNLHTRIALFIVLLVGTSPRRLVAGFMIATGFISMWVSNTATAVMMLPVGLSVLHIVAKLTTGKEDGTLEGDIKHLDDVASKGIQGGIVNEIVHKGKDVVTEVKKRTSAIRTNFGISLMLGIAYSASIGSLATIIGTPPNALLIAYMKNELGVDIGFGQWMLVGLPIAILMLIACWLLLVFVFFKPEIKEIPGGKEIIHAEYKKLGKVSSAEWLVGLLFVLAALSWIFLGFILKAFEIKVSSLDSIIAMSVSVLLFIIPANRSGERLIDWDTAKKLPWDILILFGGGLALSAEFSRTGLSLWIGHQVSTLDFMPIALIILIVTALVIFLTEITSNTATAAAFLPVIAGVAIGLGYNGSDVLLFTIPVAVAATCAFMLPVATPPNAIAYGSGYVRIVDMIKAGFWLNIIGIFIITLATIFIATYVFSIKI
ncbi:carboxylate transporter [Helicobacter sp. 13S00401-1]|uniref:SLC13 family permease n=1 Tax=Helicobacter sp. 13S00401-1 TaxID=1905758 RepID=UPI000BA6EE35|nr:DASS family sodium-coupled anion symporter [Helicobacter sp. 13S00401-1]PAF49660.1 carboxylate transporter [Helicobacter sp. 13S00401-1]